MSIFLSNFTTKIKRMKNKLLYLLAVASFFCGCNRHVSSSDLSKIDSLVSAEKYDSAYHEVIRIKPIMINNEEDKAHYNLLLTQTSCLTGNPFPPDSLIDFSISYYEKTGNKVKLCDAYYYKAFHLINKRNYTEAVLFCKKAEKLANQINSSYHQMKVVSSIAYINEMCGNYDIQLLYARKALEYAMKMKKKNWMVSSYSRIGEAYQFIGNIDSAIVYADKVIENKKDINIEDLPYYLNCAGYAYIKRDPEKAKALFKESLSYKCLTKTLENLAYIYHKEGNEEEAYELWKQALLLGDDVPQDKILYNILHYNLTHHNIDDACKQLYSMVSIKDSLNNVLKDRTIQNIQQEYDEKVVQEKHEQVVLRWVVTALVLVVIILLLLGYIRYRRYKAKIKLAEQQMLINNYLNEIKRLEGQNVGNEQQIADLNKKVNDLLEQDSPRLYRGKMLYDQIMQNGTTIKWTQDDFKCFIDFYKASDFASYARIMRKHQDETTHNIFFLILQEIGKEDKDIRQILNISQEGIRSIRYRIRNNMK